MLTTSQKIETAQVYLTTALRQANARLGQIHFKTLHKLLKYRQLEKTRLRLVKENLPLSLITQSFPSLDNLNEFYTQLLRATVDVDKLRKSLSILHWAQDKIKDLTREYSFKIDRSSTSLEIKKHTQTCLGRISSILKRAPLPYLEECRKILREYPTIKEIYTVAIAGFPNVGKSTLLSKLTTAKPEIKPYAFTTKTLNLGYYRKHPYTLQVIDTPGTLTRFNKMNAIEQQAYLALQYAAHLIVYVYDLTETSYPLVDQEKLYTHMHELDKPMIVYLSKTDLLSESQVQAFLEKKPDALTDLNQLKDKLLEHAKKH
ncbi:MAG: GTPase [Nanoarchaeota archaeon]